MQPFQLIDEGDEYDDDCRDNEAADMKTLADSMRRHTSPQIVQILLNEAPTLPCERDTV